MQKFKCPRCKRRVRVLLKAGEVYCIQCGAHIKNSSFMDRIRQKVGNGELR